MKKRTYFILLITLGAIFAAYIVLLALGIVFWSDILALAALLPVSGIAFNLSIKRKDLRLPVLFIALTFLSCAAVDAARYLCLYALRINPEELLVFMPVYLLPSVFLTLSLVFFIIRQRRSLNKLQIVVDIFATAGTGLMVIWILLFHNEFENLVNLDPETVSIFSYALMDIFIITCAIIWYFALPPHNRSFAVRTFCIGILMVSITDIVYTYLYLQGFYFGYPIIDGLYMTSTMLIAYAGLHVSYRPDMYVENMFSEPDDGKSGRYFKRAYLLLAPAIVLLLGREASGLEILLVFCIALAHQVVSNHIQNTLRSKKMLENQMAMNALLEDCVTERTAQLLKINQELEILSKQDSTTNLYNRRYFSTALDEMLAGISGNETVVLFYIDLDRFKSINDTYGHDIGDKVLTETARRLSSCIKKQSILARFGGDEFVFAFRGHYNMEKAESIAKNIIACCSEPILVEPYVFRVTLCIGITFCPLDAEQSGTLLKNADIAMYHAKGLGFNRYAFYNTLRNDDILRRYDLEMMLKNACFDSEFELHYQPKFNMPDGTLLGAEALLRWNSPKRGLVMPLEFIPIAEETGIIVPLSDWVIEKAFGQIAQWNTRYDANLQLSINLSSKQFDSIDFADKLLSQVRKYNIQPKWVDFEITESIPMREKAKMASFFKRIAKAGITVTIDDFGMGYSSLGSLKHIPVNRIKIPKDLIDHIASDERDASIVKAIIHVAKALNIHVIAEGVENSSQREILNAFGCHEMQGYLSGRPIPAAVFENLYLFGKPLEDDGVASGGSV